MEPQMLLSSPAVGPARPSLLALPSPSSRFRMNRANLASFPLGNDTGSAAGSVPKCDARTAPSSVLALAWAKRIVCACAINSQWWWANGKPEDPRALPLVTSKVEPSRKCGSQRRGEKRFATPGTTVRGSAREGQTRSGGIFQG